MVRMLHGALPTCEKMNRLVMDEIDKGKSSYYTEKYGYYSNEGMCPCCGKEVETTDHLFLYCKNNKIVNLRNTIKHEIVSILSDYTEVVDPKVADFIYTKEETNTITKKWNKKLGNYGLVPHSLVAYVDSCLDEEQKNQLKYIIIDISAKIMEINLEIWKHRCKKLYSGNTAITQF